MAKKKFKLKFAYDAPVTLAFALIAIVLFLLDTFAFKGKLNSFWLVTPTAAEGAFPFAFSDFHSIIRLFVHIFASPDRYVLICNLIFILLLKQCRECFRAAVLQVLLNR